MTMRKLALPAVRAHWPKALGVFFTMTLASALITITGILMESGLRESNNSSPASNLLTIVASSFGGTAVIIAVLIVSAAFAAALRERRREFALLRAVGATPRQIYRIISTEVMAVSFVAIIVGAPLGLWGVNLLKPVLVTSGITDETFSPSLSAWPIVATALILIPSSWLAGRLAGREVARLSPVAAVSETSVDARSISKVRTTSAIVTAALGVAVAFTPFFVPGTIGSAMGTVSALLLITAAALAGPAIVLKITSLAADSSRLSHRAPTVLAVINSRGFARRLSAAVIPLAVLVSLGTVQTGLNHSMNGAVQRQLDDGLSADLVVTVPADSQSDALGAVASNEQVTGLSAVTHGILDVKYDEDDEDIPFFSELSWEPSPVLIIDPDSASAVIDPGLGGGDLTSLGQPDTVAVSSDALFATGKGVGDSLQVRYPDGSLAESTIALVFGRGLGFGDIIIGHDNYASHVTASTNSEIYVTTTTGASSQVASSLAQRGYSTVTQHNYVAAAVDSNADQQLLSTVLVAMLLGFIAIAAGNTLMLTTRSRRREFALLHRLGATRRQTLGMLGVESGIVASAAIAIGTLATLPALCGAAFGLLGRFDLGIEPAFYGGLAGAVVIISLLGLVIAGASPVRQATTAR